MPNMRNRIVCLVLTLTVALVTSSATSATRVTAQTLVPTSPPRVTRPPAAPRPSIVGIEVAALTDANAQLLRGAGAVWVRRNALQWAVVEPEEGARNWAAVSVLEQEMQIAAKRGLRVILIIRDTPGWAQRNAGLACGPIRADKMAAFGAFVRDAVARYSAKPFGVTHFEIWNEPDVQTGLIAGDSPFGCWGDSNDPFYGGGYYAEALKAAYPQLKAANPQAQLVLGGLLLGCNPDNPPANAACPEGRFFEGVLSAGGGNYLDVVNFHGYDYWDVAPGKYSNANWNSTSIANGPVVIAKARFLKSVMERYGVTGKSLFNTESAMLCGKCPQIPAEYEQTKAAYVPQAYAAAQAEGLAVNMWYSLEGWRGTNLIDGAGKPLPAYTALQVASTNLGKATFVGNKTDYPGVWVYEFTNGGKRLWVAWSPDGQPKPMTLPRAPTRAFDALGKRITPAAQMTVDANPIYLEWPR
jgi:hypothetical protein